MDGCVQEERQVAARAEAKRQEELAAEARRKEEQDIQSRMKALEQKRAAEAEERRLNAEEEARVKAAEEQVCSSPHNGIKLQFSVLLWGCLQPNWACKDSLPCVPAAEQCA